MKRILKKRSVKRLNAIFKEGRDYFPKEDFTKLTFMGMHPLIGAMFSAKGGVQVGNFSFADEAEWSE